MNITKAEMAAAFKEWRVRWEADPDGFETDEEMLASTPEYDGKTSMEYFVKIIKDLRNA